MKRLLTPLLLALTILLAQSAAVGAPNRTKRAYKPAQPAAPADPAAYEQELQAAKEERDKKLASLDEEGIDRRTLEKRKTEIFAEYAKILAAMRDKYEAANPPPAPARRQAARKPARSPDVGAAPAPAAKAGPGRSARRSEDPASALADAEAKLREENDRHAAKLDELNAQLRRAETAGNKRDVRKLQKAIEKENTTYNAKRPILERRVKELGGDVAEARVDER